MMMRRCVPRLQAGCEGSAAACKEPGWTCQPDYHTCLGLQQGKEMGKFL